VSHESKRVADFVGWRPFEGDPDRAVEGDEIRLAIRSVDRPEVFVCGAQVVSERAKHQSGWWMARIKVDIWAGRLPVVIHTEEHIEERVFDVRPADGRFPNGQAALDTLLEVLLGEHSWLPWGVGPTFRDAVSSDEGMTPGPPVLHPAVLAVEGARLEHALHHISRQPLWHLVRSRAAVPFDQCQRADEGAIRRLIARPDAWQAALFEETRPAATRVLIDQPVVCHELNHPANQALRGLLERLHLVLGEGKEAHATYAARLKQKRKLPEQRVVERMREAMASHQTRIAQQLRHPFWRAVKPAEVGPAAAQAFSDHPVYGRAYRSLRRLLRPDVRQQVGGLVHALLRPAFDLFELFVWLRVRRAIAATLGKGWQWTEPSNTRVDIFQGPVNGACAIARRGRWTVAIRFQQEFVPALEHFEATGDWEQGRYSLSGRRRPDVVIEATHESGRCAWAVIDAKFCAERYSIESNHLPALHIYRDALRWQGRPPAVCFIVTPALTRDAGLFQTDAYRSRFNFGVIVDDVLTTSTTAAYMPLTEWLGGVLRGHRARSKSPPEAHS
jgi:hypothetical protein